MITAAGANNSVRQRLSLARGVLVWAAANTGAPDPAPALADLQHITKQYPKLY